MFQLKLTISTHKLELPHKRKSPLIFNAIIQMPLNSDATPKASR